VRPISEEERKQLEQGLKSKSGFTVRRSQMLLMSGCEGIKVGVIGKRLGCSGQAIRRAIHAFEREGIASLKAKSKARHDDQTERQLKQLVHRSPDELGYETQLWTLQMLVEESVKQGIIEKPVTIETMSNTLQRMGINWQRVRQRITSPD
jgi:transposase